MLLGVSPLGLALEVAPEAGSILRNMKPELSAPRPSGAPIQILSQQPAAGDAEIKIEVKGWRINGASLISIAKIEELLQGYIGKALTLEELRKATANIAAYYQAQGYFARAILPAQEIRDGVVTIVIIEGKLGKIEVDDPAGVYRDDLPQKTMHAAQAEGDYMKMPDLQRGILLLNDLPGGLVSSTLKPGSKAGDSDLNLKITPGNLLSGSLDYANAGIRSVGQNQFGGTLNLNNPLGIGDLASLRVQGGSGNVYGRVAYSLPVGYSGLRIGLQASGLDYTLGDPFKALAAQGSAWTGGIFASYPLLRGVESNLYLSTGFDDRRYYNTSLNSVISDKQAQVGYISLNGDFRDQLGSGSVNQYGAVMVAGSLDLSDNAADQQLNNATAKTAGAYQKFLLNFSRLQNISEHLRFFAGLSGQMAPKNLDSSEKFSLGGPYGVRAYPVNEALGDQGYLMNFELRYDVYEHVELIGFIDHGGIGLHVDPWTGSNPGVPNQYTLSGGGVGINWSIPGNFIVRGSLAQRIGANPGQSANGYDSDGTSKTPHVWVSLSKFF